MNILGIYGAFDWEGNSSFDETKSIPTWVHDAGATLFIGENHIASISEERLSRIKYDGNFPKNSIDYVLKEGNVTYESIDEIYVPSMCLDIFYRQLKQNNIEVKLKSLFPNATIKIVSHHLAHAASSIFSSDFNDGSVITLDGAGSLIFDSHYQQSLQAETNIIGYFNKSKRILRFFNGVIGTNNFGAYYHDASHKIYCKKIRKFIDGYSEKHRESWDGKIMGLSAYGKSGNFNKSYFLSKELSYSEFPYVIFDSFQTSTLTTADEDAHQIQKNFENGLVDYFTELKDLNYLEENICLAGGSFLNVLGNSLLKKMNFNIHIPPYTNDTGLHFGAACYGLFKNQTEIKLPTNVALLGKEYSNEEIEKELKNVSYKKYNDFDELCEFTAQQLAQNKIIGWFQGRSEYGPRALGSRSLLMNPTSAENKNIMNSRIKHREYWRPFAGIILEEHLTDYFEEDFCSPYMLYSLTVKSDKIPEIAAITHVDQTCRIQTVNYDYNERITTLLNHYHKITGIPVIMNTSFNDNGEPIVESPKDAINSFMNMDIDYLVIGDYVVEKNQKKSKLRYQ